MAGTNIKQNPKVFISYSWKNEDYKKRVLKLAEQLFSDGVEVILDQWDLKPGHDLYYFMENSIEHCTRVLILCEETYAQKADNRGGGVGAETDIITPEIYQRYDQEKFIPVIMEHPRKLPKYLKRILAVDLTEMHMEDGYTDLLCAIYGITKNKKPDDPGSTPSWIMDRMGASRKPEKTEKIIVETRTETKGWAETEEKQSDDNDSGMNGSSSQTEYPFIIKPTLGNTPEWVQEKMGSKKPLYRVGDTFRFGSYPYEAGGEKKDLEWRILAVKKDRMLIITKDLIDCVPYNEDFRDVTWEECTLRKWMNGIFINETFTEIDKSRIVYTNHQNPDNINYNTNGGRSTKDRVFALNIYEARQYFKNNPDRMSAPTPYVKEAYKDRVFISDMYKLVDGRRTGWWWLRSPGLSSLDAANVYTDGDIIDYGNYVTSSGASVRPALWLNL